MPDILITTIGGTWQIVPELLGFTNPDHVDFFKGRPNERALLESRQRAGIHPVDEIWIITTSGEMTDRALAEIEQWHRGLPEDFRPSLHIRKTADIEDPGTEDECRYMAECIFRLVLHCSERTGDGQLLVSLAGGRKTMSADMQNAAMFFGCHALLHVIQSEGIITPLVIGQFKRNPMLDLDGHVRAPVTAQRFHMVTDGENVSVVDFSLTDEIWHRQQTAGFLYCNHTNRLMGEEKASNFLALYHLEPTMISRLKEHRIGVNPEMEGRELAWLKGLPKAELHCHLGGIADARELIEIAEANRERIGKYRGLLSKKRKEWRQALDGDRVGPEDFKDLRTAAPGVPEPLSVAAFILLFENESERLDELMFGQYRDPEVFCDIGFDSYETLGDLQGSGLLQSEESLRAACGILVRRAREHKVKHLEVRCSPVNYNRGGLLPEAVARIIDEALSSAGGLSSRLLFIASRHGKMSKVHEHIELARNLMGTDGNGFPRLCGFDLAGNEKAGRPREMREAFMSMMEKCMHFTIHAGEGEKVKNIWEAVYHLNAERVGHGLTLLDDSRLLERLKDRKIAIEMCPSSNFQILGFKDKYLPETDGSDIYPLKAYLDAGLRVTVNTDNPGISRTDFTRELHRAARLTPGGLSLWEILLLIRNGFRAAFAGSDVRNNLLRQAESEVIERIQAGLPL